MFSKLYFCEKYFFTMMKLPFINRIFPSYRSKIIAVMIGGVIVGGGALFMYMLRAHTYLGDDPAACVNCHIMSPYYATWFHSSHARDATCNDCHVPHENIVKKWTFKGMDGMKHVAAFQMCIRDSCIGFYNGCNWVFRLLVRFLLTVRKLRIHGE